MGSFVAVAAAALLMAVVAAAFSGTVLHGHFTDAGAVAQGLDHYVGHASGSIFAIILLNASIIGAASVTLATSYAFGDASTPGTHSTGARREGQALLRDIHGDGGPGGDDRADPGGAPGSHHHRCPGPGRRPVPSATVFLLLLCNDKAVLGPWVNGLWLNMVAVFIVSILS